MKIVTHNVKFHTDDVFAVAALLIKYPNAEISRTRDEAVIASADIVADVGGLYAPDKNRFDHHQIGGAGERSNGIPYSSFGLVWKKFGEELAGSKEVAQKIDSILIQGVDAGDNGKELFTSLVSNIRPYSVGSVVGLYRPTWKEEDNWDKSFLNAVSWAKDMLNRMIKVEQDSVEGIAIVNKAYEDSGDRRLVIIDSSIPLGRELVNDVLSNLSEPLYAVLLRRDHLTWQLLSINRDRTSYTLRKSLPQSWRGKKEVELQELTSVVDAVFCHSSGFMCIAGSREGAIKLAQIALEAK